MEHIVEGTRRHFDELEKQLGDKPIRTGDIRKISSKLYRKVEDKSMDNVLSLCEVLLGERMWAYGVIAYDFAYRVCSQYTESIFPTFERWLIEYVRGWGSCDDFCTHAFGELLIQYPNLFERTLDWTEHEDFWVRRGAAVILIPMIKKDLYHKVDPFKISDLLMEDEEDLVRKGYGWMLKVLAEKEPQKAYDYLEKHKDIMPRVAFRYAMEKMDTEMRKKLMSL